jgi:hypothetical protein
MRISWFESAERHVHATFDSEPNGQPLLDCVQKFYPNMTPENVAELAGSIFDRWDEFNKQHPSLASPELGFSPNLIADIRLRITLGEDINSVRLDLLSRKLSLPQADEIVGRAILSEKPSRLRTSSGFMVAILSDLPLGHMDALNICRTEVAVLRKPPQSV